MKQQAYGEMRAEYEIPRLYIADFGKYAPPTADESRYRFEVFYHPYVCEALRRLARNGIDALLAWPTEAKKGQPDQPIDLDRPFFAEYAPNPKAVLDPPPVETLDLGTEARSAYSQYNWELFFHAPLLIADRLGKNQRFEEAQAWFHHIFDPTDRSAYHAPERFWKLRRFYDDVRLQTQPRSLSELLAAGQALTDQVDIWLEQPFQPHLIAQLRTIAYQKTVVMKYLDNLIAWGDQLFRRDTREAINLATQLYVLAAEILGRRPEVIPPPAQPAEKTTFNQLYAEWGKVDDDSSRRLLADIENLVPVAANPSSSDQDGSIVVTSLAKETRFFCVPANDKLLGYWDTIADRLFKIRNCMNIEGVVRELPLFEPPIPPDLLVRAAAAGVDLSAAVAEVNAPVPPYRFGTVLQKALEVCNEVKGLGGALLAALEKRDGEALGRLRQQHEVNVLSLGREVKVRQIEDANRALEGLRVYQQIVTMRQQYYATRQAVSPGEQAQLDAMNASMALTGVQLGLEVIGAILHLIPDIKLGALTTIGFTLGGGNIGAAISSFGASLGLGASLANTSGSMSGIRAGYERRSDEWAFQAGLATKELEQCKQQILGAEVRLAIAEHDLATHDRQIDQAKEVGDFLRDKFTSDELYDWMVGQLSAVYFQSYQLAYDVAKRAERAYRHERADEVASFIHFGDWDNLRKGLLAGEKLAFDLRRMEAAYLDQNRRELEITKHVSLALVDPEALLDLRETGQCFVSLPEALYDADYPGHYLRRLRSVGITIPCVAGPYEGVHCTLTLLQHRTRTKAADVFKEGAGAVQAIVTSTGQNDTGMFETNLRDERYLPFEGAGAVSGWRIELPKATNRFDRATLTDAILHVRYTALDGGEAFRKARGLSTYQVRTPPADLAKRPLAHARLLGAADFGDAWSAFKYQDPSATPQTLALALAPELFPPPPAGKSVHVDKVLLLLRLAEGVTYDKVTMKLAKGGSSDDKDLVADPAVFDGLPHALFAVQGGLGAGWTLTVTGIPASLGLGGGTSRLDPALLADLGLLLFYSYT